MVGQPTDRHEFLVIDKPTKSASKGILVGQPADLHEFLVIDKPTKLASEGIGVGSPAPNFVERLLFPIRPDDTQMLLSVVDRRYCDRRTKIAKIQR